MLISHFDSDLNDIRSEAETLSERNAFSRFIYSSDDADAVTGINAKIVAAYRKFQVRQFCFAPLRELTMSRDTADGRQCTY